MGILGDTNPLPSGPPNTSQFPGDSVLGRMARGNFKPAEADLEELQRLAQDGNRAERRAAAKHLKKQGLAAPPAVPRAPVVIHTAEPAISGESGPAPSPAPMRAQALKHRAAKEEPANQAQAPRQSAPPKAAQEKVGTKLAAARTSSGKSSAKKAAVKKAAVKKPAATKAPVKRAPGKATPKKAAVKKSASRKAAAKKSRRR